MDFSHEAGIMKNSFVEMCYSIEYETRRPSVLFKPRLFLDGNMWCALLGENLQIGVSAFGESPDEAMQKFDKAWITNFKIVPKRDEG